MNMNQCLYNSHKQHGAVSMFVANAFNNQTIGGNIMKKIIKIICFIMLSTNVLSQESDFTIEKEINSPIDSVGDISCMNEHIYLLDDSSKNVFKIDENGAIKEKLNFNLKNITGLACFKDTLFLLINKNDTVSIIHKVDINNYKIIDSILFKKTFGPSLLLERSQGFYYSCLTKGSYSDQIIKIDSKGNTSFFKYRMGGFLGICIQNNYLYQLSNSDGLIIKYNLNDNENNTHEELALPTNNIYGNGIDCYNKKYYVFSKENQKIIKLSKNSTSIFNNFSTKESNVFLYPNPSHNVINISKTVDYEKLSIFNSKGELIYNSFKNCNKIKLQNPGIYIANFHLYDKTIISKKFIIY